MLWERQGTNALLRTQASLPGSRRPVRIERETQNFMNLAVVGTLAGQPNKTCRAARSLRAGRPRSQVPAVITERKKRKAGSD
jgi:hypothetical protein